MTAIVIFQPPKGEQTGQAALKRFQSLCRIMPVQSGVMDFLGFR